MTRLRIARQIQTRNNKTYWLINIDDVGKALLLQRRRFCIDFEKYRVVQFVSIARCFKCQEFGHLSGMCEDDQRCAKCTGLHFLRDCNSDIIRCHNCYFQNADGDCAHRSDNLDCPAYKEYRLKMIPQRS